ncbi:helix-turn-helix domain-containing protein [Actinoplanes sp. NPDC049118]|uniref:helix-turn-helix domain-containing protein n=1 Tax=Actinoplanes sp. NPDC049118 TaxID=3155769 RepID=UPI0033F78D88
MEISAASEQLAFTVPHAAKVLDLSPRTVWYLANTGQIESIKIGRSRRITRAALIATSRASEPRCNRPGTATAECPGAEARPGGSAGSSPTSGCPR